MAYKRLLVVRRTGWRGAGLVLWQPIRGDGLTKGLWATAPQLLTSAVNLPMESVTSNSAISSFMLLTLSLITMTSSLLPISQSPIISLRLSMCPETLFSFGDQQALPSSFLAGSWKNTCWKTTGSSWKTTGSLKNYGLFKRKEAHFYPKFHTFRKIWCSWKTSISLKKI